MPEPTVERMAALGKPLEGRDCKPAGTEAEGFGTLFEVGTKVVERDIGQASEPSSPAWRPARSCRRGVERAGCTGELVGCTVRAGAGKRSSRSRRAARRPAPTPRTSSVRIAAG